jgi:hypothetical protein
MSDGEAVVGLSAVGEEGAAARERLTRDVARRTRARASDDPSSPIWYRTMVVEMRAFDPSIFANERDDVYDANAGERREERR